MHIPTVLTSPCSRAWIGGVKCGLRMVGEQPACDLEPFQYSSTHDMRKPPMHVQFVHPVRAPAHLGLSDAAP